MNEINLDRIRLSEQTRKESQAEKKLLGEKSKKIDFARFTLLIVDDEEVLRSAIVFDFKRKGFTVLAAESGLKALEIVKTHEIHLIISDIRMPDGDGIFLLERVQALEPKIPVVLITGFTDHPEAECLARGAFKVIAKPFDRKALMASVIEALAAGHS